MLPRPESCYLWTMQISKPDKILCVGRNYLKHALELGNPVPTEPLYFIKAPSVLKLIESNNLNVELPKNRGEVHHELELVFRIRETAGGFDFSHFGFGLDLTLRELQEKMKKAGQPWEKAKSFRNAAILGPWLPLTHLGAALDRPFELKINGQVRQKGVGSDMAWKPDYVLKDLQNFFPLCDGDLLFTGTPEGVGPMKPGDRVSVESLDYSYAFTCS